MIDVSPTPFLYFVCAKTNDLYLGPLWGATLDDDQTTLGRLFLWRKMVNNTWCPFERWWWFQRHIFLEARSSSASLPDKSIVYVGEEGGGVVGVWMCRPYSATCIKSYRLPWCSLKKKSAGGCGATHQQHWYWIITQTHPGSLSLTAPAANNTV